MFKSFSVNSGSEVLARGLCSLVLSADHWRHLVGNDCPDDVQAEDAQEQAVHTDRSAVACVFIHFSVLSLTVSYSLDRYASPVEHEKQKELDEDASLPERSV